MALFHFELMIGLSSVTFAMVFMSAISPVLIGWFIDRGVTIDHLARGFSLYAFIIFGLAYWAYRLSLREGDLIKHTPPL